MNIPGHEFVLIIIIILNVGTVFTVPIATYFLNKNMPYNESFTDSDWDQECLYARGNFSFKSSHTVCYRYNSQSYAGPSYPYLDLLQFGTMGSNLSDIAQGYMWGNWPSGEEISNFWIGFPVHKTPTYVWSGFPPFVDKFNRNVWKHQCFAVDLATGKLKYFCSTRTIVRVLTTCRNVCMLYVCMYVCMYGT